MLSTQLRDWLQHRADDDMLRGLLVFMLIATVTVTGLDYVAMTRAFEDTYSPAEAKPIEAPPAAPVRRQPSGSARGHMTFDLAPNGRLIATGEFVEGTAALFRAELASAAST